MQAERSQALPDVPRALVEKAPAKVNLTLRILGRRADGYHDLESLVAFAEIGDRLRYSPGGQPALTVRGLTAQAAGAIADNVVLRAAHALADQVRGLEIGRFALSKHLPVAAGLGGRCEGSLAEKVAPPKPDPETHELPVSDDTPTEQ